MSTGPRIPLPMALAAATRLMSVWSMSPGTCAIVGSVRRRKVDVGDVELIAPLPEPDAHDGLYDVIHATLNPPPPPLFHAESQTHMHPLSGKVVEGFKRGFKACSLVMSLRKKDHSGFVDVPVQIFRYIPGDHGNRGWVELMRTGPDGFGQWFLHQWKLRYGIPPDKPASKDGRLVDSYGQVVPTPTEDDCFRLAQIAVVAPQMRATFIEHREAARRRTA